MLDILLPLSSLSEPALKNILLKKVVVVAPHRTIVKIAGVHKDMYEHQANAYL